MAVPCFKHLCSFQNTWTNGLDVIVFCSINICPLIGVPVEENFWWPKKGRMAPDVKAFPSVFVAMGLWWDRRTTILLQLIYSKALLWLCLHFALLIIPLYHKYQKLHTSIGVVHMANYSCQGLFYKKWKLKWF